MYRSPVSHKHIIIVIDSGCYLLTRSVEGSVVVEGAGVGRQSSDGGPGLKGYKPVMFRPTSAPSTSQTHTLDNYSAARQTSTSAPFSSDTPSNEPTADGTICTVNSDFSERFGGPNRCVCLCQDSNF